MDPQSSQENAVTIEMKPLTVDVGAARVDGAASPTGEEAMASLPTSISLKDVSVYYAAFRAIKNVSIEIPKQRITAFIGPSGCGKSTLLRSINRMHETVPGARVSGQVLLNSEDLYAPGVDAVQVRRRIGMVFQKANPFPKSIYDNIAFGPRVNGFKGNMDELVEASLRRAALWDEVKDKLKQDYSIVIVTHNMQQAARASDVTVMMTMDTADRAGYVVEQAETLEIFTNPKSQVTEDYVSGRFG